MLNRERVLVVVVFAAQREKSSSTLVVAGSLGSELGDSPQVQALS